MIRFALALLLATPASAAEITREGDTITISGRIEYGDDVKFAFVSMEWPLWGTHLVLNSNGGNARIAMLIGDYIRKRKYETWVRNGAICNSSCALIWLAGASRQMDPQARIGVHSAQSLEPGKAGQRWDAANIAIGQWLAEKDISQPVIELFPKADPCCVNYITYPMAKAWGLITPRSHRFDQHDPLWAITLWKSADYSSGPGAKQKIVGREPIRG